MRVVATNAHKNPIVFDCPWMHAEDEEVFIDLQPGRMVDEGETINIHVPRLDERGHAVGEPHMIVQVSLVKVNERIYKFNVDVLREGEGPESIFVHFIAPVED